MPFVLRQLSCEGKLDIRTALTRSSTSVALTPSPIDFAIGEGDETTGRAVQFPLHATSGAAPLLHRRTALPLVALSPLLRP